MQVVGVVVTYNRVDVLGRSLQILANQSRPLDHLIVVDNGNDPAVQTLLEDAGKNARGGAGMPVTYLPSQHNLGGAGGFRPGYAACSGVGCGLGMVC